MKLSYGSNVPALTLTHQLNKLNKQLTLSLERLSTGYKVNRASDGASQILISEGMSSQIRGYAVATSNVQQGLSMLETADGALQSINEHLQHIREIAVAASNGTTTADQFSAYQADLQATIASINAISANTKFGTNVLLDGSISGGAALNIQMGPNSGETLDIKTAFTDNSTTGLGVAQSTLASVANATTLLGQVDAAILEANTNLSLIGGFENRMTDQMSYLSVASTNVSAAQAAIRNTDVAAETANITRLQILQQAAAYALVQANTMPQLALSLLP